MKEEEVGGRVELEYSGQYRGILSSVFLPHKHKPLCVCCNLLLRVKQTLSSIDPGFKPDVCSLPALICMK